MHVAAMDITDRHATIPGAKPYAGKTAAVVGAGRSGRAAALLLRGLGADVRLLERNSAAVDDPFRREAEDAGVELRLGEHGPNAFRGLDMLVPSPGVPAAKLRALLPAGESPEIMAEMEMASRFVGEPIIAVTGSSGKTTTVSLIGDVLQAAGKRVFVGGNIGAPLSEYLLSGEEADILVLEVSSFQAQVMSTFRPRVAVFLNFAANHLDYHQDMDEYLEAKLNLFGRMEQGDLLLTPADMDDVLAGRSFTGAEIKRFQPSGRFRSDRLLGKHNLLNIEAAFRACEPFGATEEHMHAALKTFRPQPHRLQIIGKADCRGGRVLFADDSKATTLQAMEAALHSFDKPILLLAGGVFKGGDPAELTALIAEKVRAVGLFGGSKEIFESAWSGAADIIKAETLCEAVQGLMAKAEPGDVMLLSPATSSFDQYAGYAARGDDFADCARKLPGWEDTT